MRAVMLVLAGVVAAGTVAAASAGFERPEDSRVLTDGELQAEMGTNERLDEYIESNGWPDVAERQFLADAKPWDDYQVTIYYLDDRKRLSFARAWLLGEPSVQLEKSDQPLSEEEVERLRPLARPYGIGEGPRGSAVERAEAAALRSEDAAARADAAAAAVERAAERAEAVVAKMASGARRSRRR